MASSGSRTVRAVFEAVTAPARKGMRDLSKDVADTGKKVDELHKDLADLDGQKVQPDIDVKIDDAKKRLNDVKLELADLEKLEATPEVSAKIDDAKKRMKEIRGEIKTLQGEKAEFKVQAAISDAQRKVKEITRELGDLRTMEVTPEVSARITEAQKRLRDAKSELRDLNAAKATMTVDADTKPAQDAFDDLDDAAEEAGDDAGESIVSGILGALKSIPIAGAVIGVGAAIAGGILIGIKQGLAIEAERDLFAAQTGLDEETAAKFGRAAGEAYASAWGDSVADNLDAARRAMAAGIIDSAATEAEIENVVIKLQGLNDLFEYDIAMAVQAVGNAMKTGLVRDANQAFDLVYRASQKLPSDDLLDTLNEYSNQFVTLGLTADQAFGLIVQGAEAGARDTDKVADTLKEMGLRIREGTDPAIDALKLLGLNHAQIVKDFQTGGPAAAAAMDQVFDALRNLQEKGGNTQEVIATLFGGPGEDLGAALFALDLDGVAEALGGVNGAAGAADQALKTMSDNASTKIEEAKRNIEIAMDGIKGALAEAFGDQIEGAAGWVARNRAPLMEFFVMVIEGAFEMGRAFVDFAATGMEAVADILEAFSGLESFLNPIGPLWRELFGDKSAGDMKATAAGLRETAGAMRTDFTGAIDEMEGRVREWAAPEIMKARIHDATLAMTEDLDFFLNAVEGSDIKININGNTVPAENVLDLLIQNINGEDGTVTINGDKIPAEEALTYLLELARESEADIIVGADLSPAQKRLVEIERAIAETEADMKINGDTAEGYRELYRLKAEADRTRATIKADIDLSLAKSKLDSFVYKGRTVYINAVARPGMMVPGGHDGGWLPGRWAGGWVPGSDPGYDNVLWPLHNGGRTLIQPLAGGEFVVNSKDAAANAAVLEAINSGARFTGDGRQVQVTIPVQTTERADPVAIGAEVAWRIGGLP